MLNEKISSIRYEGKRPHSIRMNNYRLLIYLLRDKPGSTIGEIANELNLSKTTIAKMLQKLKEKNLVLFDGKGNSTDEGGKRPDLYIINKNYKYCIVFFYPESNIISCKVYGMSTEIVYSTISRYEKKLEYEEALSGMVYLYQEAMLKCGLTEKDLYGIVLCTDGIVDSVKGILCNPISFHYWEHNKPLKRDFVQRADIADVPVYMDNICRYAGYAEMMCEANRKYKNMAVIHNVIETDGIGGCIIRNRQIDHGYRSCAGEIGHLVIDREVTEECRCGNRGCFEQLMSSNVLLRRAAERYKNDPDSKLYERARKGILKMDDVLACAEQKEPIACQLLEETAVVYAWVICNIMITASPEVIVIQGLFTQNGDYFFQKLREKLSENLFFKNEETINVKKSECPWVELEGFELGAAQYARDQYFDNDSLYE